MKLVMPDGEWPAAMECIQNMHRRLLELEKEREMLWKTVDRLEAEKRKNDIAWIDVNDRAPERDDMYLVRGAFTDNDGDIETEILSVERYLAHFRPPRFTEKYSPVTGKKFVITHWMHIPPFKEETP